MSFTTRIYKSNGKAYDRIDVTSETLEAAIAAAPADCHSFEVRNETGVIVKHGFGEWAGAWSHKFEATALAVAAIPEPVAAPVTKSRRAKVETVVEEPLVPPTPEPEPEVVEQPAPVEEKVEEPTPPAEETPAAE